MKYKFGFYLLFMLFWAFPQEVPTSILPDSIVVDHHSRFLPTDSLLKKNYHTQSDIYTKKMESGFQKKYQGEEFDYNKIKPHDSLWNRIERRINQLIHTIFGKIDPLSQLQYIAIGVRVIAILLVSIALYFLIKFLASKNGNLLFSKKNKPHKIDGFDLQENIHEINFAQEIAQCEIEKKYRLAIRYRFLWMLKKLNDQKIIQWDIEKTNLDFVKELQPSPHLKSFVQLVHIFDFVWYGDFHINEGQYAQYKKQFENFIP